MESLWNLRLEKPLRIQSGVGRFVGAWKRKALRKMQMMAGEVPERSLSVT